MKLLILLSIPVLISVSQAHACENNKSWSENQKGENAVKQLEAQSAIGTATMLDDRTIVLRLVAKGQNGEIGDAQFKYAVNDPDYERILRHVGGLEPISLHTSRTDDLTAARKMFTFNELQTPL